VEGGGVGFALELGADRRVLAGDVEPIDDRLDVENSTALMSLKITLQPPILACPS
jgi:hypothetical protein